MDRAVYRKTNKGIETIEQRRHALGGRMRGVLIMVDGFTSRTKLEERLTALGTPVNALDQLLAEGFIEVVTEVVEEGLSVDSTMAARIPNAVPSSVVVAPVPTSTSTAPGKAPNALRCPLRKPVCIGMDCAMSYGCSAKQGL